MARMLLPGAIGHGRLIFYGQKVSAIVRHPGREVLLPPGTCFAPQLGDRYLQAANANGR